MRRVWILRSGLSQADVLRVVDVLRSEGCAADELEVVDELGPPSDEVDDEVCIFLLTDAAIESPAVQSAIASVPRGGRRAICIWPEGATEVALPEAITSFSYSILRWQSPSIRKALGNDDETVFEGPTGGALPQEDKDHKECEE